MPVVSLFRDVPCKVQLQLPVGAVGLVVVDMDDNAGGELRCGLSLRQGVPQLDKLLRPVESKQVNGKMRDPSCLLRLAGFQATLAISLDLQGKRFFAQDL